MQKSKLTIIKQGERILYISVDLELVNLLRNKESDKDEKDN